MKDLITGEIVTRPGKEGEILAKSPWSMTGYLKCPGETEKFFDADGFGATGDVGYFTQDGLLHYVDRIRALIR